MNEFVESRIGHVYAVVSTCGELVKIGRSKTPEQRMKTITTYSGKLGDRFFSPKLKNCVFVESAIHKIFEKERVYGEWFRINLSDAVRCIEEYLTTDILADENYILKAKDVSIKRNLNICKVMGIGVNKDDLQAIQEAPQQADGFDELPEGFTVDPQPDVTLPATIPDQSSLTQQNEGLRLSTYMDTTGNPTIGHGFNFNSGIAPKVWKQSGLASYKRLADVKAGRDTITPQEAQALYQTSYQIADNDARQYFKGYEKLAEGQKTALRDMAYQFGLPNLKKMRSLHNALQKGDKNAIVNAIRNSEYGRKYQDRARQITNLLVGDA